MRQSHAPGDASLGKENEHQQEKAIIDALNAIERGISEQIVELSRRKVPDKIIKLAQSDHVIWKKRQANMAIGKEKLAPSGLADHQSSRLGKRTP